MRKRFLPHIGYREMAGQRGFTMVELMVAMLIGVIVLAAIYATHNLQQATYRNQTMVTNTQQNLRGAMYMMQRDLLMAGYDPTSSGRFGIEDITKLNNNSAIEITADNGPGASADNGTVDAGETIAYQIFDSPQTSTVGNFDLGRSVDGGDPVLIAEGIEALGLAYAYDADGDGELDRSGGNVIWAVDSDNDNRLDTTLEGGAVNIDPDDIRAVRIWLLGRTRGPVMNRDLTNSPDYVVAERVVSADDNYDRRLLTATINLRNLGL